MASLYSRLPQKSKSQMTTVLQELGGECFPSFAALPFLNALLLSLPVAIAPIWIAALPRPRFPSSACLSKKALPFFLSLFLSSRCVPPSPPNPFRSPCWYFSLCSSHFRLHSSLGNVDLFLTSSS
ncbi:hypothetical protein QQF64_012299 [Cirrhinus molitorella]|uniref:Uncharacterized protein n=1 Tax=Cirrhinus molitorella TaxID=172907 RepID=A0ABR3LYI6_9TELE